MAYDVSVCNPWATLADLNVCTACGDPPLIVSNGGPVPDAVALENIVMASNLLFRLSAMQFGTCQIVLRPCCSDDLCGVPHSRGSLSKYYNNYSGSFPFYPHRIDGSWFNVSGLEQPCMAYVCGSQRIPQLDLDLYPICTIDQILIDGVVLPPADYRVDDFRYVIRLDGSMWPQAQNLLLPSTDPGTWEVTVTYGVTPPPEAVRAVAELACQLTLACAPDGFSSRCVLPDNVVSLNRQGVTFDFLKLEDIIDRRLVGIASVDRFITQYNPYGHTRPPVVMSPTYNRFRHRQVGT